MENLTQKLLKTHLVSGKMVKGEPISIKIDQTLTQDATGTMAYMQFEAMGVKQVKTELSVSYVDHNTLQSGYMNADDHAYLQSVASKYGIYFSKAGNGICHQVHLERFAKPGKTLIGSDSHTPTSSAIGCLAIGAGGLDVAKAMAGIPYRLTMPEIVEVRLHGRLNHGVSSKDIILELLRKLSVKGGVGRIFEYTGDALEHLSVYQRATITNMGAELGATSSIFPSDEITREFLKRQGREKDYVELKADPGAPYDEVVEIHLDTLVPLAACPNSPDAIKTIRELEGTKVDQVAIGSCTNSGYEDMMKAAAILKGKTIAPNVSLVVSPGSRQVLLKLIESGALATFIHAGARILESACGPCIGMGQSPKSDGISLRTFNRNFYGRSGTLSAGIYLVSPEVAAASAIQGVISDPSKLEYEDQFEKEPIIIDDSLIYAPSKDPESVEIVRGPNIKPIPVNTPMPDQLEKKVVIKLGNNITTDHIAPAGAKVLPYRSNIEKLSTFVFENNKEHFDQVCKENHGGIIVAKENYGQGSSREHAALAPMYLGIKTVICCSFARIHKANLINFGILPLTFEDPEDYKSIEDMDDLILDHIHDLYQDRTLEVYDATQDKRFKVHCDCTDEDLDMIMAGGALNYIRNQQGTF